MKVVAYSIKAFEKEPLAKANQKKHDITLISNPLNLQTCHYAQGKEAVLVFNNDEVSAEVINKLADQGVRYIATRSSGMDHIDKNAATARGIKLANVVACLPERLLAGPDVITIPDQSPLSPETLKQIAEQTVKSLDLWQLEGNEPYRARDYPNV